MSPQHPRAYSKNIGDMETGLRKKWREIIVLWFSEPSNEVGKHQVAVFTVPTTMHSEYSFAEVSRVLSVVLSQHIYFLFKP